RPTMIDWVPASFGPFSFRTRLLPMAVKVIASDVSPAVPRSSTSSTSSQSTIASKNETASPSFIALMVSGSTGVGLMNRREPAFAYIAIGVLLYGKRRTPARGQGGCPDRVRNGDQMRASTSIETGI